MQGPEFTLVLRPGEYLSRQGASSPSGEYSVYHQPDGNVVVYRNTDATVLFATGTQADVDSDEPPGRLVLTEQGELVVEASNGARLWKTGAPGGPDVELRIFDDGSLRV